MKIKTLLLITMLLVGTLLHARTLEQGNTEAMRGVVPGSYNFWIFTPEGYEPQGRGLPLVIHSRNAHRPLVETLRPLANRLTGGIFHCFGGTAEEADELLRTFPTFMLGIGGVVTFKKSTLPQVLADVVPLDRLVVETDAPYLAPTPHRGHRNEPAFIPIVLQRLAEVYGCSAADIAAVTTANARRIFKKLPLPFAS